jgi:hypothetical protein
MGRSSGVVPGDARYFTAWIDREVRFYEGYHGFHSEADRREMVEMFERARAVYERLSGMPNDTVPENHRAQPE